MEPINPKPILFKRVLRILLKTCIVLCILFTIFIAASYLFFSNEPQTSTSSINTRAESLNAIDLDDNAQSIVMNKINSKSTIMSNSLSVTNDAFTTLMQSIGAKADGYRGEYMFSIPLSFSMLSSKTLKDSTQYLLHSTIVISSDEQTKHRISQLYNQSDVWKDAGFFILFGWNSMDGVFDMNKNLLLGSELLHLDVKLMRQDVNSNWTSISIHMIDPSNLKASPS